MDNATGTVHDKFRAIINIRARAVGPLVHFYHSLSSSISSALVHVKRHVLKLLHLAIFDTHAPQTPFEAPLQSKDKLYMYTAAVFPNQHLHGGTHSKMCPKCMDLQNAYYWLGSFLTLLLWGLLR